MKILKNKTKISAITFVLMLTFSAIFFALPTVNAATESNTHAFITVSPDPVGVGQDVFVAMWLIEFHPESAANIEKVWHDFTLTITKPNGVTEKLVKDASPAATVTFQYTVDQVGEWTFKFDFPGEQVTDGSIDNYYRPSSASTVVTVQEEPIVPLPQNPLPTDYWQRPVNWVNQFWWPITGNWFGDITLWDNYQGHGNTQGINPYSEAPRSAHVLYTFPIYFGGQIGGAEFEANDRSNYFTGKSYQELFYSPIIMNGIMYYNDPLALSPNNGMTARNLRTGEILWRNEEIDDCEFGSIESHHNPNEVGGWAYLWDPGSTYKLYDAWTGRHILDITGMSGQPVIDKDGFLRVYNMQPINETHGFFSMWNSSKGIGSRGSDPWTSWSYDPPEGETLPASKGIEWNVTVPIFPQAGTSFRISRSMMSDGVIMIRGSQSIQDWQWEAGYDMETGQYLWHVNRTWADMEQQTNAEVEMGAANGIYYEHAKTTGEYYAYDIHTGELLWGPTEPDPNAWNAFCRQGIGDGNVFVMVGAASARAYYAANGSLAWEFFGHSGGLEVAAPTYPFEGMYNNLIAGGLIFLAETNSHGGQLFRGAKMYAVNMTNGNMEWYIDGFFGEAHSGGHAVADGILVAHNMYDNQAYVIGRGRSETTVSAPDTVQTLGSQVLLQGTVTDQSPGDTCWGIPTAGTPAISDESMSPWMAYLYQQQPKPQDVQGVKVVITTLDPNGNTYELGRTTSTDRGTFGCEVELPVSGLYKIIASFEGSDSYYGSSAETYVFVEEAPSPAQPIEPEEPTTAPFITTELAIIAAVVIAAIIGIVAFWALRKRK